MSTFEGCSGRFYEIKHTEYLELSQAHSQHSIGAICVSNSNSGSWNATETVGCGYSKNIR